MLLELAPEQQVVATCYRRTSGEFHELFLLVTAPWQSCSAATFLMADDAPPQRKPHILLRPYLRRPESKKGPIGSRGRPAGLGTQPGIRRQASAGRGRSGDRRSPARSSRRRALSEERVAAWCVAA